MPPPAFKDLDQKTLELLHKCLRYNNLDLIHNKIIEKLYAQLT